MLPKVEDLISIDVETYDPNLKAKGPGTFRGDAHLAGVSITDMSRNVKEYIPVGHTSGVNWPKTKALLRLKELLFNDRPKLGAKMIYDLEWLDWFGIKNIPGLKIDVQINEALIDENQYQYNLGSLCTKYGVGNKLTSSLVDICKQVGYNIKKDSDVFLHLYKLPPEKVAPYGIQDTLLPIEIYKHQRKILSEEGLDKVFMVESRLTDLLLKMRIQGVPIDVKRAEQIREELIKHEKQLAKTLKQLAGREVSIWAAADVAIVFDRAGIEYPRTKPSKNFPNGQASFTGEWLEAHPSKIAQSLVKLRKVSKMRADFIESMILGSHIHGRIHSQFHQVKHDDGGTVSGRFSSSNPNLQQVPSRDPVYGPLIRSMFIPDKGKLWNKCDYSQQEPRLTIHYSALKGFKGADIAVQRYKDNPNTDYHQMVADLCQIERRPAKDINLGLAYGMGVPKMALKLNKTIDETKELFKQYHAGVPFVKMLSVNAMNLASTRGYIKTILGRRRHFDLWGPPSKYDINNTIKPLKYDAAVEAYGLPLKRAFTYRAGNALIQGSAADMMKQALLDIGDAGYVPYLTVHDEADTGVDTPKQGDEIRDIMVNAIKLLVPIKVDSFTKNNWGECHD